MSDKMTVLLKAFMGLGIAGAVMGIVLPVLGNGLGLLVVLASGVGMYRTYKEIKNRVVLQHQERK